MGDLSDLPNFKARPWYRRKRPVRVVVLAVATLVGVVAWCMSEGTAAEDILVTTSIAASHARIGSPYSLEATVKNSGSRTANIHLQLALFVKESACLETGKRLSNSFSLPMTLSVSPNGVQSVVM